MVRAAASLFLALCVFTGNAKGQVINARPAHPVTIEIQVYLPGGQKPTQPVVLNIRSDDGRINEVQYTTSSGYAFLGNIEKNTPLTVTVLGEEGYYRTGVLSFSAHNGTAEIRLQADKPLAPSVSVAELYQAEPRARKLYEKGTKDWDGGRLESAEKEFAEASEIDPKYVEPIVALGFLRLEQKRAGEAEALFERATELSPSTPRALAGIGIARAQRGDYRSALDPLEQAAEKLSQPAVLAHLAVCLVETGRSQEARPILERVAATKNPYRDFSALLLGRIHVEAGEKHRGQAIFESLRDSNGPEAARARQALRLLQGEKAPEF